MNVEKLHNKKEQADLEAKVSEAKSAVDAGTASAREQADLKRNIGRRQNCHGSTFERAEAQRNGP